MVCNHTVMRIDDVFRMMTVVMLMLVVLMLDPHRTVYSNLSENSTYKHIKCMKREHWDITERSVHRNSNKTKARYHN